MKENKQLKILHITNNYTPYCGGVVSSINAFSRQLQLNGCQIKLVSLDFLGAEHNDPDYVVRVPSISRFEWKKNRMAVPWRSTKAIEQIINDFKPDLIHLHHPFLLCQAGLKIALRRKIPTIFTYHSIYERYTHYVPFYQPLMRFFLKIRIVRFCRAVDHIIAPSSAIRDYLYDIGVKTTVSVIPSPLQEQFINQSNRPKTKQTVKKFNLLLVSRLVKEKSIKYLLEIASKLPPEAFLLKIVGYGEQEQELRDYAYKTLKLTESQLQFVIKPSKERLIASYCDADLFLFSSTSDTQGLVLAEAMACGTPVVAVDGPGQRDIIQNGKNGFIVQSQHKMVQKIKQIAENDNLLKNLQKAALTTANQYSPELLTQRLEAVYRGVSQKTNL